LNVPPPWATTQDPWGLGLIAVLVFKEIPFLLWAAATQLQRAEVAQRWGRELLLARSLGYSAPSAWWRVVWPQLWPRLRWPLLAVLAYSLTVVDMALIIGPTSPPTLAVLAWQWLLHTDPALNTQGVAAAWLLCAVLAGTAGVAALVWRVPQRAFWRQRWCLGERGKTGANLGSMGFGLLLGVYGLVMLALGVGSVAGLWPFPDLLPETLSWHAWALVGGSLPTLGTTISLGIASACMALLWSVAWLEWAPLGWDRRLRPVLYLPLVLPPVLWVAGVHGLSVRLGLDARWAGLWLAHTLAAVPYVLIALSPAYLGFEVRHQQVCASLGLGRMVFLWRVKWPLLRAALSAGFAIGFAVSVAQYLPTVFVGAGRFATVTTEAVTLAAGAQRSLTSAYALLQWGLPLLLWAWAARWGRPRRF
jgi:putative thiamine transport system permease protein